MELYDWMFVLLCFYVYYSLTASITNLARLVDNKLSALEFEIEELKEEIEDIKEQR